jgi:16S rRNA processing protein RimM
LDGALRIYPDSDFPERFLEPGDRWLQRPGQTEPERVKLLSGRYLSRKGLYVIKLVGIDNREQAGQLRNARLLVARSDRLPLEPDEFHVADLIGLAVRLQLTGAVIGTVVDVFAAGNDLLSVQLVDQPDVPVLVPFVHEIVPVVNLAERYVEVCPPRGLLPDSVEESQ